MVNEGYGYRNLNFGMGEDFLASAVIAFETGELYNSDIYRTLVGKQPDFENTRWQDEAIRFAEEFVKDKTGVPASSLYAFWLDTEVGVKTNYYDLDPKDGFTPCDPPVSEMVKVRIPPDSIIIADNDSGGVLFVSATPLSEAICSNKRYNNQDEESI